MSNDMTSIIAADEGVLYTSHRKISPDNLLSFIFNYIYSSPEEVPLWTLKKCWEKMNIFLLEKSVKICSGDELVFDLPERVLCEKH